LSFLPAGTAESAGAFSETTLHPIHRSIGVSRSESSCDGGAENASLTPSNNPYNFVLAGHRTVFIFACCDDDGNKVNPETAAVVEVRRMAVVVFVDVFIVSIVWVTLQWTSTEKFVPARIYIDLLL
jgi:hypothetical protein